MQDPYFSYDLSKKLERIRARWHIPRKYSKEEQWFQGLHDDFVKRGFLKRAPWYNIFGEAEWSTDLTEADLDYINDQIRMDLDFEAYQRNLELQQQYSNVAEHGR